MESLQAESITVNKVKNFTTDRLKFDDAPVRMNGSISFTQPVHVRGDVDLEASGRVNGVDLLDELCGKDRVPCSGTFLFMYFIIVFAYLFYFVN